MFTFIASGQAPFSHATPQSFYADSRALFDRGLYGPAAEGFRRVIRSVDVETDIAEQSNFFRVLCSIRLMNRDAGDQVLTFLDVYPTSARRKEVILEIADYSFNRRKYKDARDWLRRLDGMSLPKKQRAELQFKLGYSLFMLKDYEMSRAQFSASKSSKFEIALSSQYYYGHIAYLDTNDITALENLEPLIDHPDFGFVVPYYLAQIYARRQMDDELLKLGESLLKEASVKRTPEISKLIGQSLFRKKRYEEALPYLMMHKDRGGKMTASDYYELGVVLSKAKRFKEAIQSLNKITSTKGEVSEFALYLLANCYVKENQSEYALSAFRAVSQIAKDVIIKEESTFNMAKLTYLSSSPFGNAISAFKQFLLDFPDTEHSREVNEYLANLYITSKDYSRAMQAIVETGMASMAMREAYQRVSYYRAVELYHSGSWKKTKEYFNKSLTYPQNLTFVALAHFWMGELAFKKGDSQEALAQFESFLKTPGSYSLSERPISLYNKAYCLYKLNKLEDAAAAFRIYIQDAKSNDKKNADAMLRLADLYFLLGKHSLAREFYNKFSKKSSSFNNSYASYADYQQSLCLGLLGRDQEKIALLTALSANETRSDAFGGKYSIEAIYELGKTQLQIGDNIGAESSFIEYVRRNPNLEKARRSLLNQAIAQRNDGRLDVSILTFKSVISLYPGTLESKEAIASSRSVFDEANRLEDYLEWVNGIDFSTIRASELDSVAYMSGLDKYAQKKLKDASVSFLNYLKRYPDGFFALNASHYVAECSRQENDIDNALNFYRKVTQYPISEYSINAWAWVLRISSQKNNLTEMQNSAERLLSLSDDPQLLREANVALMRVHQEKRDLEVAHAYAEVVASDERNTPEIRVEARLYIARNAHDLWAKAIPQNNNLELSLELEELQLKASKAYSVLKKVGSSSAQAEASYFLAYFLNKDKSFLASNEEIFWLIDNLPSEVDWRYKALIILAKNYSSLEDDFQAIYTLDFLISEDYNADLVEEAKVLKQELKAIELAQDLDSAVVKIDELP